MKQRRRDGSYIIEKGGYPYHVTNSMAEYAGLEQERAENPTAFEEQDDRPVPNGYKELRAAEYPALGDMIDALVKAEQGDKAELDALISARAAVKAKYPKE